MPCVLQGQFGSLLLQIDGQWGAQPGEGRGSSWPLGQILTPLPSPGSHNSTARNCASDFGSAASSSLIWTAGHYPGGGIFPPSPR